MRYKSRVIMTFANRETERFWTDRVSRRLPPEIQKRALMKLALLEAATSLEDLRAVPGNRLEVLAGSRAGQHSIRINDQWRVCFSWRDGNAHDVEITDYH